MSTPNAYWINNILTLHVWSSDYITTIQNFDSPTQTLVSQTGKMDLVHMKQSVGQKSWTIFSLPKPK
jgi:hypothetical protein